MNVPLRFWSSRAVRRRIVLGTYASYLLLVFLWEPSKALGNGWLAVVGGFSLLTMLGYTLISAFQVGLLAPRAGGALDERQRAVQDRAFRVSYQILSAGVLFAALYGFIAADSGSLWLPETSNELQAVFWGVWLLATTLPAAMLCWLEPEPPEDEPTHAAEPSQLPR